MTWDSEYSAVPGTGATGRDHWVPPATPAPACGNCACGNCMQEGQWHSESRISLMCRETPSWDSQLLARRPPVTSKFLLRAQPKPKIDQMCWQKFKRDVVFLAVAAAKQTVGDFENRAFASDFFEDVINSRMSVLHVWRNCRNGRWFHEWIEIKFVVTWGKHGQKHESNEDVCGMNKHNLWEGMRSWIKCSRCQSG